MEINLRKFTKFVDKTFVEGGKEAKETCSVSFGSCCF